MSTYKVEFKGKRKPLTVKDVHSVKVEGNRIILEGHDDRSPLAIIPEDQIQNLHQIESP